MENKDQKKRPTLCVELLNTFSEKELDSFTKFISSEYFNTDKLVIKLLNVLRKRVFNITFFDNHIQRRVYESVFGNLPDAKTPLLKKHKNTLNVKLNALLRLAEKFIAVEKLQNDQWSKLDYLYAELLKRKQYHLYKRHFNKDIKAIEAEKINDITHYENLYKIYWTNLEYLSADRKLLYEENINKLIDYNDLSYLLKKLNIQVTLLSLVDYPQKKYNLSSYTAIEKLLSLPSYKSNNQIKVLLACIELKKKNNIKNYKKFLSVLYRNEDNLSKIDQYGFYQSAINFCTTQIRKGNFKFYEEIVSIYNKMHQYDLLKKNETISPILLTNIITVVCRVGKYDLALEIERTYIEYIDKPIRKDVHNYNFGLINFFKKEFSNAHKYFLNANSINSLLDLNTRIYILKCLYEENTSDYSYYFAQHIRSLKEYLKNQKKIHIKIKKGYVNFTNCLLHLYNFKFDKGKFTLLEVENELNQQTFLSNKMWLLEKIADFKKND